MKDFKTFVLDTFSELAEQFKAKNEQYGDIDPVANFRKGAMLKYGTDDADAMYEIAKDYELKHISHVYGHGAGTNKVDESLKDIAIYSIIELYFDALAKEEMYQTWVKATDE